MRMKTTAWIIVFALFSTLFVAPSKSYAESQKGFEVGETFTLQQPPYSIGDGWNVDSTFSSNAPYSLAFGDKEYVAVGPYGTVMKSTDGLYWRALSKFKNYHLTAIAWDGSQYVMFGANTDYEMQAAYVPSETFVSKDAVTWTKIEFEPGEPIQLLEYGKNGFVAVGNKHVFHSKDGHNWTKTYTLSNPYAWYALKYVNGTYFMSSYDDAYVLVSKDGVNWSAKTYDTSARVKDMIWTGKHYIGVGNGIYTSSDGYTWKKQANSPSGLELQTITYGNNRYVVTGYLLGVSTNYNVAYISTDGVKWAKKDLSHIQVRIYAMYPVNGGFAGIGSNDIQDMPDGTYSIFTKDGSSWSYRMAGTSLGAEFGGVATNGKRTVAVGLYGNVIYTDDGKTWRSSNPFSSPESKSRVHLFDVAWGANKFVAVANGGVYYSTDGISWKKASVPFTDEYGGLREILWTGKFFVASDQVSGVFTSKDGLKWTKIPQISDSEEWLVSMTWDGKRVLGALRIHNFDGPSHTEIVQTTDGVHWTKVQNIDLDEAFLAYNGSSYVAMNRYNTTKVWVSKDGLHWSKKTTSLDDNDGIEFLTSFDGYFFAFNDSIGEVNGEYVYYNAYYVSQDGVQWKEVKLSDKQFANETFGSEMMKDGVKAHGKYIFVGAYGNILTASELQLQDPIIVKVLGETLSIPAELGKPYVQTGTTYIPLKAIGDALGYEVKWDQATKRVTFTKDGKSVQFSDIQSKNNRSYVPLRKISESLNYLVKYEKVNGENVITIDQK